MSVSQEYTAEQQATASISRQLSQLTGTEFLDNWLAGQCRMIEGANFGVLVGLKDDSGIYQPLSIWPDSAADLEPVSELLEQVIEQKCGLISELGKRQGNAKYTYALAYPLLIDNKLRYIVSITAQLKDQKALTFAMQVLQWGCAWLELGEKKQQADHYHELKERLGRSVEILARVLSEESASAAMIRFVTELAAEFKCDRVSIGFIKNRSVRLKQISHSAQFGQRMNLVRLIEAAMNESVDQSRPVILPDPQKAAGTVVMAHQTLVQNEDESSVMTIPLYINQRVVGAVTLERGIDAPFTNSDLGYCESISGIVVTSLVDKIENDRWVIVKLVDAVRNQLARILGPDYVLYKFAVLVLGIAVTFLLTAKTTYNLSTEASLKGALTRAVVAPYDGYIDTAPVRAGDAVGNGNVLVTLDTRDFVLEKLRSRSQVEKLKRQHQEALAGYDRAGVNVISAQLEQAEVQLQLVEMLLERAVLKAPFNGVVVSGDLSQRLGGAVSKGEVLFEISPNDDYRLDLMVKESRITEVEVGQHGRLYLSAIPERPYPITIMRITPTTVIDNGESFFIVEAGLDDVDRELQIGMKGIAQVEIGERKLLSVWTRDFTDWVRLKTWSWSF